MVRLLVNSEITNEMMTAFSDVEVRMVTDLINTTVKVSIDLYNWLTESVQ